MSESIGLYAQNHVDLLNRADYIDPALYKEYGVKSAVCVTLTVKASLRA